MEPDILLWAMAQMASSIYATLYYNINVAVACSFFIVYAYIA